MKHDIDYVSLVEIDDFFAIDHLESERERLMNLGSLRSQLE